jgi:hypothetical protein
MEYGRIVRRAWDVTWRHKALWLFGILAALFGGSQISGGGGGGRFPAGWTMNAQDVQRLHLDPQHFPPMPWGRMPLQGWPGIDWSAIMAVVGALAVVILIVALIGLVLRVLVGYTSRGALIAMVQEVEETEKTTVRAGWRAGWRRFLRLFAIDLLISIAMAIVVFAFVMVILLVGGLFAVPAVLCFVAGKALIAVGVVLIVVLGLVWLLLLIAGAMALSAVATLVRELSFRYCMLAGQGVFDSIRSAIARVRAQPTEGLLMWLLLAAIELALGLAAIPFVLAAIAAVVTVGAAGYAVSQAIWGVAAGVIPVMLLLGLISLFVSGLYLVFRSAVWTLVYRELEVKA